MKLKTYFVLWTVTSLTALSTTYEAPMATKREVLVGDQPHRYRVNAKAFKNIIFSETSDIYSVTKIQIARKIAAPSQCILSVGSLYNLPVKTMSHYPDEGRFYICTLPCYKTNFGRM